MPHRAFDAVTVRCPRLGGPVKFGYCRELEGGLPCSRALVCFERSFPVAEYFRRVLREETYERIFVTGEGSRDRVSKILDEVSRARDRTRQR